MKRTLMTIIAAAAAVMIAAPAINAAPSVENWKNPNVVQKNRLPMRATFSSDAQQLSLNGTWKFKWYETPSARSRDFFTLATNDSDWDNIPVPGLWELNGYGDPIYVNIGYAWRGHYENNPPIVPEEHNYVGQYRKTVTIDPSWIGKDIVLTIGSATSNVTVWVNGKEVGYSQDSKLEANFDITKYVHAGENLIALEIFRWCDGSYLEDQDFWRFSGLARDTYLRALPKNRIDDLNVSAHADGSYEFSSVVTPGVKSVKYTISAPWMEDVTVNAKIDKKNHTAVATGTMPDPQLWSAETPTLYTLTAESSDASGVTLKAQVRFGFRDVKVADGFLLVNGKPVLIKGADRHEMDAYKGYVVSEADMIKDIKIMKQLNINAVRTCHYPDDPRWLQLCDEYGLYVVAEANIESHGMGYGDETLAKDPQYELAHLERVSRMVKRDINHPSIIVWSLGNEAGNGPNFVKAYDWVKGYDLSRPVQYERAELERNTDIYCPMYLNYDRSVKYATSNPERPLIQCEYAHAMGNSMGGFKEYWDIIRKYPHYQGGFIWDFVDQAQRWPADSGKSGTDHIFAFGGDFNDYDASDKAFNCNGVIAADRSYHPHTYEVAYQHRSILTTATPEEARQGRVSVYNENFFIDLSRYMMSWEVVCEGKTVLAGSVDKLDVAPQQTAAVKLGYGASDLAGFCKNSDLYLNVSYTLKRPDGLLDAGQQVAYDQICIYEAPVAAEHCTVAAVPSTDGQKIVFEGVTAAKGTGLSCRQIEWKATFDKKSGALCSYVLGGRETLSAPLMPCFGRATTENDLGAKFDKKMAFWMNPEFKLQGVNVNGNEVSVSYAVADAAVVEMKYSVFEDGSITVSESMKDAGKLAQAPNLFRFGMELTMPGNYSVLDFYGKGPWESYADRQSSAMVGRYTQRVEDQYHYGYPRPQESGTHVGLKWMNVIDEDGCGLGFASAEKFSGSALPFSREEMKAEVNGKSRHSLELKGLAFENQRSNGKTCVNIDLVQMGLGCVNSWGAIPRPEYMLPAQERTFEFVIVPVLNK